MDTKKIYTENFSEEELKIIKKFQQLKKDATTKGMQVKVEKGNVVSRAPLGYKIENKKLLPATNSDEVQEIFNEFFREQVEKTELVFSEKYDVSYLHCEITAGNFAKRLYEKMRGPLPDLKFGGSTRGRAQTEST